MESSRVEKQHSYAQMASVHVDDVYLESETTQESKNKVVSFPKRYNYIRVCRILFVKNLNNLF